jgi:hypothetical protein
MKHLLTTIKDYYHDDNRRSQIEISPLNQMDSQLRSYMNEVRFLEGLIGSSRVQSKNQNSNLNYIRRY